MEKRRRQKYSLLEPINIKCKGTQDLWEPFINHMT
ncbi:Uncharacterised protein [Vibrio cholerae]|nr:Uncharacterised protein [Vibrio cholerae]